MIVFDLRCRQGHVFEAWFGSSADYAAQRERAIVRCPVCNDGEIEKAVMAPAIGAKGNRSDSTPIPPAAVKAAMRMIAAKQAELLKGSEWVGGAFANRARAMHAGDEDRATIHGQASVAEAKALVDDGIAVVPLPLPVAPPKTLN